MNKRMISLISILFFIILAGVLLASCGSTSPTATSSSGGATNSSSNGQTLMQERCSVCHSTERITSAHKTAEQWKTTADRMISHGAQLTPQEEQTLVDYLAQTYK